MNKANQWPSLPYDEWRETLDTLHMKMQVAGKVKLALTPFLNHWWNVAFHVTVNGITTELIPYNDIVFEIDFDFINHNISIRTSDNQMKSIPLVTGSVAGFYKELMSSLNAMDISVTINKVPSEVSNPVPCDIDERSSYNKEYVFRWWSILVHSQIIFEKFRSGFRGKSSPVHFFWGSFDLCGTRFSGKPCSPPPHSGRIMHFAENEENFTFGFWAGNSKYPKPAFYSYIYPAPEGTSSLKINPQSAGFDQKQGLFILDYNDVQASKMPHELILQFLESTYNESARLAGWDVESLKARLPDNLKSF
jgi:hypothetical protein